MRKPETIEYLYLDFDGFFASVMQQLYPALRGKPIGITPFATETDYTVIIACSKEAKARGIKNVMRKPDARKICPDLIFVPQEPDMFRRAHNALCSAIQSVIPIDVRKSIDELTCRLDKNDIADPHGLSARIKAAIAKDVGEQITCSIGFGPNRHIAKIACKMDKPNGVTIWGPDKLPDVLNPLPFDDIPGIGGRMQIRLWRAGIYSMKNLLGTEPKQMRKLWGNVTGERLWYALHGYAIKAEPSNKGMYGHGRTLAPDMRTIRDAYYCSRILLIKAARRMRRDNYYATQLNIWLNYRVGRKDKGFGHKVKIFNANDDQAAMTALNQLWQIIKSRLQSHHKIIRIGVFFGGLVRSDMRQLDMLHNDDEKRQGWERLTSAIDDLNSRYGRSVVTLGPWPQKYGAHLGTKIAYTRIPRAEDAY